MTTERILNKLDNIQEDITEIKVQTTKSNGRITAVEKKQSRDDKRFYRYMGSLLLIIITSIIVNGVV